MRLAILRVNDPVVTDLLKSRKVPCKPNSESTCPHFVAFAVLPPPVGLPGSFGGNAEKQPAVRVRCGACPTDPAVRLPQPAPSFEQCNRFKDLDRKKKRMGSK